MDKSTPDGIIPNLEVYIVDVWPSMDDYPLPFDLDGIRDRKNDLTYGDKTPYEEQVTNLISDYYNLTKSLLHLAKDKGILQSEIDAILSTKAKSTHGSGKNRTYLDLLNKRFDITQIVRIERCPELRIFQINGVTFLLKQYPI